MATLVPATPEGPVGQVQDTISEQGTIRREELVERADQDEPLVDAILMHLLKQGEIALFPVGDSVQIRSES